MNLSTNTNLETFGKQLHDLGDRIEKIAEQLRRDGKVDEGDELYQLGDEVEHFFEQVKATAFELPDGHPTKAQRDSSCTVNASQDCG